MNNYKGRLDNNGGGVVRKWREGAGLLQWRGVGGKAENYLNNNIK